MTHFNFTHTKNLKSLFLVLILSLGLASMGFGQKVYTTKQNGNWTDNSTWVGGNAPKNWEENIININHTVTNPGTNWLNNTTINIAGSGKLILNGSLTGDINLICNKTTNSITIENGGNFGPSANASLTMGDLIINSGGKFKGDAGGTFLENSKVTVNSGGSFAPNNGDKTYTFADVVVNGGTFGGNSHIEFRPENTLTVNSGTAGQFTSSSNTFGTVIIKSGGTISATNGQQTFKGKLDVQTGGNYNVSGGVSTTYYGDVFFSGNINITSSGGRHEVICATMTVNKDVNASGVKLYITGGNLVLNANYKINGGLVKIQGSEKCGMGGVVINGKVENNGDFDIDGSLELGDKGEVSGSEPKFDGTNRVLIYRKSSNFSVGSEWKLDIDKIPTAVIVRMEKDAELKIDVNRTVAGSFTLETGSVKVVGTPTLTVKGDWIKYGSASFDPGRGTVKFDGGNTPQVIKSNSGETVFYNLENNNTLKAKGSGLQINDTVAILNTLKLNDNSNTVLSDGSIITIKSGPNGTASISPLNGATIKYDGSGAFMIERYLDPTRKAWHFLSVPTDGSTFHQSWQENNDPLKNVGKPGYGTMLTGTKGAIGYDYTSPQSSLRYFDPVTNKYVEIENTAQIMNTYSGYMVFIRGDRSILPTNTSGYHPTVMRTKGKIYTGNSPKLTVKAGEWALIGNPYPSDLDFTKILINGVENQIAVNNAFYIWDASLAGSFGTGAFRTIQNGLIVPGKVEYKYIPSGYAFFVKNTSNAQITITIPETAKVAKNSLSSNSLVSNERNIGNSSLRVNFYNMSTGTPALVDGTYTAFIEGYAEENKDAEKIGNLASENMGILYQNKSLTIQSKDMPTELDTIQFKMNNYKVAPYRYEIIADKLDASGQDAYLFDKFLNTFTLINPNGTTYYNFDVKGSPTGSWDETRFSVVFRPSSPNPVTITNVKAYTLNADVRVEWQVENESNMEGHTVEVSTDGTNFSAGGNVAAANVGAYSYQWTDVSPAAGYRYYRIASLGKEGKMTYSKIVRVLVGSNVNNSRITIYPNPIQGGIANLQFENQEAGTYQLRLLNTVGQVMMTKVIAHAGGSSSELLRLGTLTKGIYHLEILKDGVRVMSEKVVY